MSVEFEDDINFERQKYAMETGQGPGAIPHMSAETKLHLSIVIALAMGATLFIWLHYIASRPVSTNVPDMRSI